MSTPIGSHRMINVTAAMMTGAMASSANVAVNPHAANTIGKNKNPMMLPTRSMPCVQPTAEPLIGVGKDSAA